MQYTITLRFINIFYHFYIFLQFLTYFTLNITVDDNAESDNPKKIKDEVEKLKLDEIKFREERVCMPDPKIVYKKAYSLANKLSDDINQLLLSQALDKLVKLKDIKPLELKENPSEMLEDISQIDEKISQ